MKRRKPKFLLVEGTIFPFDILIAVCSDHELHKYIEHKKSYKLNDDERDKLEMRGNGRTVQLRGGQIIIRLKHEKTQIGIDVPTLAHEISHATFFLMDKIGTQHTHESDEVFAYHQAYIMKKALNFFDK